MIEISVEELCASAFAWVCIGGWRAFLLAGFVLAFDLVFNRRIPARVHCVLWILVALRMMLPFSVESSLSMHGGLQDELQAIGFANKASASPGSSDLHQETIDFTIPDENGKSYRVTRLVHRARATDPQLGASDIATHTNLSDMEKELVSAAPYQVDIDEDAAGFDWSIAIMFSIVGIWFAVACGWVIRDILGSLRFALRLYRLPAVTDQHLVDQLLRVCDAVGVGRRPRMKEVPGLTVPAVFGVWRSTICLPVGAMTKLSASELDLVLMHEVAHVKRRDGLVLTLVRFIRAIHWFNPLAWLVVAKIRTFMEQAADDVVVRRSPAEKHADYGRLLIDYASQQFGPRELATVGLLFSSQGRSLAKRIKLLDRYRQRDHWLARFSGVAMILLVAICGLTDAKSRPLDSIDGGSHAGPQVVRHALPPVFPSTAPTVAREYDVTLALEKIRETEPEVDASQQLLSQFDAAKVSLEDHVLTVNDTEKMQRTVEQAIRSIEISGHWEIRYEIRFMKVALDQVAHVGIDWLNDSSFPSAGRDTQDSELTSIPIESRDVDGESNDKLFFELRETATPFRPLVGAKITKEQARRFVVRSLTDSRSNIMLAPKVTLFNGQSALITDETQQPFVTGVRSVRGDYARAFEPIIDVLPDGVRIQLRGEINEDHRLSMQCILTLSEIGDVGLANLPFDRSDESRSRVTVQVPQATSVALRAGGLLEQDECLLIACPATYDQAERSSNELSMCYLITPYWTRGESLDK